MIHNFCCSITRFIIASTMWSLLGYTPKLVLNALGLNIRTDS